MIPPPAKGNRRFVVWTILGIALVSGVVFAITRPPAENLLKLTVPCADFEETVRAMGVVEAARFEKLRAPSAPYERQVTWLIDEGTRVKKGDLIAQFDIADVERNWERETEHVQRIEYRQEEAKADWSVQLFEENIKRDKESERNEFAQLKFKRTQQEPPLPKEIGVTEKDKQERLVDEAKRRISQVERQRNVDIGRRTWWLKYRQGKTQEVKDMMEQYEVRAPIDSIVVYPLIPINGLIKKTETGDLLNREQPFAQLPDLNSLIVKLGVEEYRVQKIDEGTVVRLRSRAYPMKEFVGKVISVSHMASNDLFHDGRRLFEVIVAVDNVASTGLKVGMVVEASLIVAKHPQVYAFPRDYVVQDDKGKWLEIETASGRTQRRPIEKALLTDDFVLISRESGGEGPLTVVYRPSKHLGDATLPSSR
ncbi:MAG: hypothetical protein B9S32_08225 [Verrucomicrobia bacterium Tous-C9LFEB]|nr:MAG: hypothetical protein B9S32_08225 [Verrucomicrobia bacterium Tous-C9LFEB]